MDFTAALDRVNALSVEDRIRLVQAVWDAIPDAARVPDLTDERKADLDRRLAELRADPGTALTWDEIKARVTGRP